jgi:hypothetical protein
VALQGTLDTFALADVLRLLASTNKSGRLRVSGDRGTGSVWLDAGQVVGSEADVPGAVDSDGHAEAVYHLLRFAHGSFTFEAGSEPPAPSAPVSVEPLLHEAEALLEEWRSIEAVVPSLDAWLTLRPELDGDEVTVDALRWSLLAAIGGGAAAGEVGESRGLGEMAVLRAVKDLVEAGLVEVGEAPVTSAGAHGNASRLDDLPGRHFTERFPGDHAPAPPSLTEMRSGLGAVGLSGERRDAAESVVPAPVTPAPSVPVVAPVTSVSPPPMTPAPPHAATHGDEERSFGDDDGENENHFDDDVIAPPPAVPAPRVSTPFGAATPSSFGPSAEDAAEIARQLANLSPRAAKAVAAAAKASTEEEREAALAAIEAEDDTVNRGLLLKFLGSVDS